MSNNFTDQINHSTKSSNCKSNSSDLQKENSVLKVEKLRWGWRYLEWIFMFIFVIFSTSIIISLIYTKNENYIITSIIVCFSIITFLFSYLREKRETKKKYIAWWNKQIDYYKEFKHTCKKQEEEIEILKFSFFVFYLDVYSWREKKDLKDWEKLSKNLKQYEENFLDELEVYEKLQTWLICFIKKNKIEKNFWKFVTISKTDVTKNKDFFVKMRFIFNVMLEKFNDRFDLKILNSKFTYKTKKHKNIEKWEYKYYFSIQNELQTQNEFLSKIKFLYYLIFKNWEILIRENIKVRTLAFVDKVTGCIGSILEIWKQNRKYAIEFVNQKILELREFASIYTNFELQNFQLKTEESISSEIEDNLLIVMLRYTWFYRWFLKKNKPVEFKKNQIEFEKQKNNSEKLLEFKNRVINNFILRNYNKLSREKKLFFSSLKNKKLEKFLQKWKNGTQNFDQENKIYYYYFCFWFSKILEKIETNSVWENIIYDIDKMYKNSYFLEEKLRKSQIFNVIFIIQKIIDIMNFIENCKMDFSQIKIELAKAIDLFNQNLLEASLNKFQKLSLKITDFKFENSIAN